MCASSWWNAVCAELLRKHCAIDHSVQETFFCCILCSSKTIAKFWIVFATSLFFVTVKRTCLIFETKMLSNFVWEWRGSRKKKRRREGACIIIPHALTRGHQKKKKKKEEGEKNAACNPFPHKQRKRRRRNKKRGHFRFHTSRMRGKRRLHEYGLFKSFSFSPFKGKVEIPFFFKMEEFRVLLPEGAPDSLFLFRHSDTATRNCNFGSLFWHYGNVGCKK